MKRFLIAIILILLIPSVAYADENDEYNNYLNQFDLSFYDELSDDVKGFLNDLELDTFDFKKIYSIKFSDILEVLKSIFNEKLKTPLNSFFIIIAFVIISAFIKSISLESSDDLNATYSTISSLVIALILLVKISSTVEISAMSLSLASDFIYAFIPAFCVIVAAGGGITTAFSTNTTLLLLSQGLSFISSNIFMPLINSFLAIGVCSGLREQLNLSGLLSSLKRIITTFISFVSAMFVSILSIKTAVSAKSDILGIRSVRFLINTVVPVIGGTISEGLLSIQSYSSLVKSSVGIVGIIAVALVFIPSIIEVACWRFVLSLCSIISDMFNDKSVSLVTKAFQEALLLINVILILSMVTTIISIGILIASRTA